VLRNLSLLLVLFGSVLGCSPPDSYKGYAPVTFQEAQAFGEQLVERTSQGDASWLQEVSADLDSLVAVYVIAGRDVPYYYKNPTEQELAVFHSSRLRGFNAIAEDLEGLSLKEVKTKGNSYVVVFDFTFKKNVEKPRSDREEYLNLLKRQKTGEIVIAGMGVLL
jgi:hypothetical protein